MIGHQVVRLGTEDGASARGLAIVPYFVRATAGEATLLRFGVVFSHRFSNRVDHLPFAQAEIRRMELPRVCEFLLLFQSFRHRSAHVTAAPPDDRRHLTGQMEKEALDHFALWPARM